MAPAAAERIELAKLCSSKDWSKAIRILDSLLAHSCSVQDLCVLLMQLELQKHVIKDCNKALQLDPMVLQGYILKGHAFSALGRKEEALSVWEQGYEHAVCRSADLKQLLELEDLLRIARKNGSIASQNHAVESSVLSCPALGSVVSSESSVISDCQVTDNGKVEPSIKLSDQLGTHDALKEESRLNENGNKVLGSKLDARDGDRIENNGMHGKLVGQSETDLSSESCIESSVRDSQSSDFSDICSHSFSLSEIHTELMDEAKRSKKFCVTRISKNKSINIDFRLSRGIAQVNDGKYANAISIFDKILEEEPDYPEALIGRGTAYAFQRELRAAIADFTKFYQDIANSEKALQCLNEILQIDGRLAKAYHLRGLLWHVMGEHRNAIKELSTGLSIESSNIECLYLRGSCYHAVGEFKEAVKDYDAALDLELDSMEKFVLQCLAFYQKEIALYTASKFNTEFSWFDLDGDIDPLFKEYWCKRLHPKNVCEKVYRQPPLRDSLRKGKLKKQEFSLTKQKSTLLQAADSIGKKIQYHCPGFLPNRRQYRMAGLAAIEIAQKVSKVWRSLQTEWKHSTKGTSKHGKRTRRKEKLNTPSHNRGGAGCSTSSFLETSTSNSTGEDRSYGRPTMPWHGVYSLAVKWRQISEPCDPVLWVNKLSEEFNSGFGSHTPLMLGQAKVVRYFPNYQRALNVAKAVIKDNKYVRDKDDNIIYLHENGKQQEVMNAESSLDLYETVGKDFWLATWCNSTAFEGKRLEGTRITLVKSGQVGCDFAIRTPCTPARWDDFEFEMTSVWEALCDAYCGENYGSTDFDVLENVREAILRMTYYWYNFMPLSRGTAAVGFIVLLGLLLAANMEFSGSIPEGVQVDWEAILEPNPSSFVSSVKSWLYPSLKINTSWKGYPDVSSTLETTGLVAALSTYSD